MWQAGGKKFQDATNYLSVKSLTFPRFSGSVQHSSDEQKSPSGGNTECQKTQIHFHTETCHAASQKADQWESVLLQLSLSFIHASTCMWSVLHMNVDSA